ncbi:hypothetical protein [Streptomyces mirabilis]|uniref:hypothetical protein n=1 Tax=Streptomyces mirabilis TaxID=68239 RepID=UPI0033EB0793
MGDNKSAAVFNFGEGDITFGGSVVMGDQVGVSGVVYGDVVMGSAATSEDTDGE